MRRSRAEVEFGARFFGAVADASAPQPPICISLSAASSHGATTPMPYSGRVFAMDPFDSAWLEVFHEIVTRPDLYVGGSKSPAILVGLEPHLRLVTAVLAERGFNFTRAAVQRIYSTGDYVTSHRRQWYERTWSAPLIDRYSMSEIAAGASACGECGRFHFDTHVIAEVLDPITREPVKRGLAVPTYTTLFPFIQKQPLIRYWSGDLVEVYEDCPLDEVGFTFKGRLSHCVLDSKNATVRALLLGADVLEALEPISDVATSARFSDVQGLSDHSLLGHPKCVFALARECTVTHLTLRIELRYAPYAYPERARAIKDAIRTAILQRHPDLAMAIEDGSVRFDVEFGPCGQLGGFDPATIGASVTNSVR